MHSSTQLKKNQEISNAALSKMEGALASLNKIIEDASADKSRSRDWLETTVKAAREKAMPVLNAERKTIQTMAEASGAHRKFWASKPMVLAQAKFDTDVAKDAQIRMAHAGELSRLPVQLLVMQFQNAVADKNMPHVYQCWIAGMARQGEPGFTALSDFSLDTVELPEQSGALAAIDTCAANAADAERVFFVAAGQKDDPIRRINIGRMRADATRHIEASASV